MAVGGIGTYAFEATRMLAEAGHEIEVFAAGKEEVEPAGAFGVRVHRLDVKNRKELKSAVIPIFLKRHRERAFDVFESPEYGPEGEEIRAAIPDLPLVVKLHTPTYIISRLGYEEPTLAERIRFAIGGLRRGRWVRLSRPSYHAEVDPECTFARSADEIAAPSRAIGEVLCHDWKLDPAKVSVFPYPFRPDPSLLSLPYPKETKVIGFLGRLEARKGVVELAKAIPEILREAPDVRFRLIGPSWPYRKKDMETWIRHRYRKVLDRLEFVGSVGKPQLSLELSKCDLIVLPSRWESFGLVCAESMASGRAVLASSSGGMAELIEPDISGLVVKPNSPESIKNAILFLIKNPMKAACMGEAGRTRVLQFLAPERILPLQIASYERAIQRATIRLAGA